VDDSRDITKNCQEDVDQQVGTAAALKENTERRKDDGKNDLADVAGSESHCKLICGRPEMDGLTSAIM